MQRAKSQEIGLHWIECPIGKGGLRVGPRLALAVLFLDENERLWELVTDPVNDPVRIRKVEANAVKDLKAEGWATAGPFPMSPGFSGMTKVKVWGYTLRRGVP
jgi:hypothetical protein